MTTKNKRSYQRDYFYAQVLMSGYKKYKTLNIIQNVLLGACAMMVVLVFGAIVVNGYVRGIHGWEYDPSEVFQTGYVRMTGGSGGKGSWLLAPFYLNMMDHNLATSGYINVRVLSPANYWIMMFNRMFLPMCLITFVVIILTDYVKNKYSKYADDYKNHAFPGERQLQILQIDQVKKVDELTKSIKGGKIKNEETFYLSEPHKVVVPEKFVGEIVAHNKRKNGKVWPATRHTNNLDRYEIVRMANVPDEFAPVLRDFGAGDAIFILKEDYTADALVSDLEKS